MARILPLLTVISFFGTHFALEPIAAADPQAARSKAAKPPVQRRRVLLIYQSPDGHPAASHEYLAGLKLLNRLLQRDARLSVRLVNGDEPFAEVSELLDSSDAAVLFLSHGAHWLNSDPNRLAAFRRFARSGGGLACLHWAMGTRDAANIDPFVSLFGACHGGPDRKYKVVQTTCRADSAHPITQGIEPFESHDEFYYRLKRDPQQRLQPLLTARIEGQDEMVAWAWQRPDQGRSFGFSGLHFHRGWKHPEYRKLVTRGVIWTTGLELPDSLSVEIDPEWLKLPAPAAKP